MAQKLYSKIETTGSETVEGHDCYKVVLTPATGNPTTEFYDKKSALLIKTTATRSTAMGEITAESLYDDYRKDGDLLSPHKITQRAAGQEFQIMVRKSGSERRASEGHFRRAAGDPGASQEATSRRENCSYGRASIRMPASGKLTIYMAG